jgi:DNA polymerase III epsilon subunit-like protein
MVVNLIVDVEADGPAVGLYSMVSMGLVDLDNFDRTFYSTVAPIEGASWKPDALAVSGFTREEHLSFEDPLTVTRKLVEWTNNNYGDERIVLWSDNIAFDWQWLNYYCYKYQFYSPFGHSGRRIGDFAAGLNRKIKDQSSWKKLRGTKHTHNALDDAKGNAEALKKLLTL